MMDTPPCIGESHSITVKCLEYFVCCIWWLLCIQLWCACVYPYHTHTLHIHTPYTSHTHTPTPHITHSPHTPTHHTHRGVHREGVQCLQLLLKPDMTYFKDHKGRTVILFASEQGAMTACEVILKMRGDAIYDTDKMVLSSII